MFDKIVFISDHSATVKLKDSENITMNLMNLHLIFEDDKKKILGEVNDVDGDTVNVSFLGEIDGDKFIGGTIRKPKLDARVRVIEKNEMLLITGKEEEGSMLLGNTPFYDGVPVYLDVNNFFSGHFAIMGNSGSGKSCGVSRLFQNMFNDKNLNPYNANIIMIDSSGEYYNAFNNLNSINPNYHYRFISTNEKDKQCEELRIPIYLLNVADLALLLQVDNHSQLPIVERMRKLALVFSQKDVNANNYKNHLIAKAIMTILYTSETAPNKRNEVFSVLASCSTPEFSLETVVQGVGYTRKFRDCFLIDNSGNFSESVLLTEYVSSFINDKYDTYEPHEGVFYNLDTLEKALNFALISEGWLRNRNTYGDAITLKVRLHSLIVSNNAKFFDVKEYMSVDQFLSSLLNSNGNKYQFVNINLDDVDDDFAKVLTKIYARLIFDFAKGLTARASLPFHLVIEEAHRYIQHDKDRFLIGYNIFERIAKEGRKYGVLLGIITQRPVELSDTVISQCSNFLIFKMNHPVDVDYIRKMVPNISDEIVEKQKTLQSGTCLGFGSAFKIPLIIKMEMPDPVPWSGNCDIVSFWNSGSSGVSSVPFSSTSDVVHTLGIDTNVESQNKTVPLVQFSNSPDQMFESPAQSSNNVGGMVSLLKNSNLSNGISVPNESGEVTEIKTSSGIPLVSFIGSVPASADTMITPKVEAGADSNKNVLNAPPVMQNVNSSISNDPVPNLVTFTQLPQDAIVGNTFGKPLVNNNSVSSNITASPTVNFTSFLGTDDGHKEEVGVSSQIPMQSSFKGIPAVVESAVASPHLTTIDRLSSDIDKKEYNDTFGKPDLSEFNTGGQFFEGQSLISANGSLDGGGFVSSIPKDLNFGGNKLENGKPEEPISFATGNSLSSFLDKM